MYHESHHNSFLHPNPHVPPHCRIAVSLMAVDRRTKDMGFQDDYHRGYLPIILHLL